MSYEEGAEYSLLDGPRRETMGEVPSPVPPERRDLFNESFFEYGSRVGVWRILDTCQQYGVPRVVVGLRPRARAQPARGQGARGRASTRSAATARAGKSSTGRDRDEERENIRRTVASIVRTTGQRPLGWFTRYACSPNTRELLAEEGGFLYDSLG